MPDKARERCVCVYLTSGPVSSVCVVRSVVWQSFILRAALALSCTQNKQPSHKPCPKSHEKDKRTKKKTQNIKKGPHESNARLPQQTQAFPLSATPQNMLSPLRPLLRKTNKNATSLNSTNKTQLSSLHLAASPGNSRGHKTGLNCSKTLAAKYWSGNSPQSAPVEKNS